MPSKDYDLNNAAFRRLEEHIKNTYPHGQFVAFSAGEIVADAATFEELHVKLRELGKDPRHTLVVQAGHVYPKYAIIL